MPPSAENVRLRELADEAVRARQLLETDLIAKFARLLNEKKSKIRALQELLAERRAEDMNGGERPTAGGGRGPSGHLPPPCTDALVCSVIVHVGQDRGWCVIRLHSN